MNLYELRVKTTFDAAHYLWEYAGKCSRLHGHTWAVEITVAGKQLDQRGIVVDFLELKEVLREVTGRFDHRLLNEIPPFRACTEGLNPTAENLARVIFDDVQARLKEVAPGVQLAAVQVWESMGTSVIYRPG